MAPGHANVVESAILLVNAGLRLKTRFPAVRVVREKTVKHNLVRVGRADWKSVADHGPLRLAEQAQNLAEIVNHSREDEPARMSVAADLLRGLQQVIELREIGVGVAVINERVQELHRLPDAHLAPLQGQK